MPKSKKKTLSPAIFTSRANIAGTDKGVSPKLHLFEHLLALVSKTYYKSNFHVGAWLAEFKVANFETAPPIEASSLKLKIQKLKGAAGRRTFGRSAKDRRKPVAEQKALMQIAPKNKEENCEGDSADREHVLDHLLSPLKVDQIFGHFIRALGD